MIRQLYYQLASTCLLARYSECTMHVGVASLAS